jgi:hypothetical protein
MTLPRRATLVPAVLILAVALQVPVQAQEATPEPEPEPYTREEFSDSMRALRRAEIVAVGAYPFTLLFAIILYDYARWAGLGFAAETAPFRRPPGEDPFSDDEKVGIAIGAAAAALGVAAADYLIGRAEAAQPPPLDPPEPEPPATAQVPDQGAADLPLPHTGVLPVSLATLIGPAPGHP